MVDRAAPYGPLIRHHLLSAQRLQSMRARFVRVNTINGDNTCTLLFLPAMPATLMTGKISGTDSLGYISPFIYLSIYHPLF